MAEPGLLEDHLLRVGLALLAMLGGSLLPVRLLLRHALALLLLNLLLLALVLLVGDGPMGVRRWFDLGPLAFQPSELAKIVLVLYLASFVGRKGEDYPILGPALLVGSTVGWCWWSPTSPRPSSCSPSEASSSSWRGYPGGGSLPLPWPGPWLSPHFLEHI